MPATHQSLASQPGSSNDPNPQPLRTFPHDNGRFSGQVVARTLKSPASGI